MPIRRVPRIAVWLLATILVAGASLQPGTRAATGSARAARVLQTLRSFAAFEAPLRHHGALVQADGGYRLASGSAPSGVWRSAGGTIDVRLPARAGAPLHIGVAGAQDVFIEVTEEGLCDAPGEVVDGALVTEGIAPDTDAVHVVDERRVEEVRILWSARAPRRARYRIERGAGVSDVRVRGDGAGGEVVEVVDRAGRVRLQSAPMFAVDARGARCRVEVGLHADGGRWVLESRVEDCDAYPVAVDPVWSATGSMAERRYGHTATLLGSGKVLVAGGYGPARLSTAEVYDPTTEKWSEAIRMTVWRSNHTATFLGSGKVLVAGGRDGAGHLSTAEVYDPTAEEWSTTDAMTRRRSDHTATLLGSGKVLVAGGRDEAGYLSTAEVYDPTTEKWSTTDSMTDRRFEHTATLVGSRKVLVAGGYSGSGYLSTAELYDPTTEKWSAAAPMTDRRYAHTATLLESGKVLVAGGFGSREDSAELYDPTTEKWSGAGPMTDRRHAHTATLLASGKVLVAGGRYWSAFLSTAEVYDPATARWSTTDPMADRHDGHSATLLGSGKVLLAGGYNEVRSLSTAEVAAFLTRGKPCTSPGHCASLRCVDSVCCNVPCSGQCEACDVSGTVGTCSSLVRSPPHAGHPACAPPGRLCAAGACTLTCAKDDDCAASAFCSAAGVCTSKKDQAEPCAAASQCKNGLCVDGFCCDRACAGQCEACDVPGRVGECFAVRGRPHGGRAGCPRGAAPPCSALACDGEHTAECTAYVLDVSCREAKCEGGIATLAARCGKGECPALEPSSCHPYRCDAEGKACRTSCGSNADCDSRAECRDSVCVRATSARCSDDRASSIGGDGRSVPCRAYVCGAEGTCKSDCTSTGDCAVGYACKIDERRCVALATGGGASGGCQGGMPGTPSLEGAGLVLVAGLAAVVRRRRDMKIDARVRSRAAREGTAP